MRRQRASELRVRRDERDTTEAHGTGGYREQARDPHSARGRPAPAGVVSALEPAFGHSLAGVRVFDDFEAHRSVEAAGASALTVGQDIFFATGRYDPDSPSGFHRLAHEMAHTVQQGNGSAAAEWQGPADEGHESEARMAADAAMFGIPYALSEGSAGAGAVAFEAATATETEAQKAARLVGQFPWMGAMFPDWAVTAGKGGVKATRTDGMTTVTGSGDLGFKGGFSGHVGQHRVTEADKDHAMESEKKAGWGAGAGYFEWMTGGRWKADDGTKEADQVRQRLTLGRDTIGAKAETTSTRDTVTQSRAMEASLKDGEAKGSMAFSRDFALDDDHQLGSKTAFDLGTKGASFSHEKSSRIKDVETGAVNADSVKKGAGYDAKDGFNANYSRSNVTEVDGQKFGTGTSMGASTKGISFNRTSDHTTTGADGKEQTTGRGSGVNVNFDGSMAYTTSKTDAQGNKTSATFGGSLDPDNLKVNAGVSRNGKSASASAGQSETVGKPRPEGGHWVVDWQRNVTAGGAAGAKGAGAHASHENSQFGTRSFKTEAEALAFQASGASRLPSASHDPTTVAGALHLEVGEMRGAGSKSTVGASAELSVTGGGFSGGASQEGSNATQVKRVSEKHFEITYSEGDESSLSFGANSLGFGATGYTKDKAGSSKTVRVDVTTAAGREAFERFTKNEGLVGEGARLIRQSKLKGDDKGQVVQVMPGVTHDRGGFTEEEEVLDEKGKTERYSGGTRDDFVSKLKYFEGSSSMHMQLDQYQYNDTERGYAMRGSVSATEGRDSFRHLADLTGTVTQDASKAKSSGKWGVEVELTPAMVDTFMDAVASEKVRDLGIFNDHTRNDLRRSLQNATDMDDKMRAMSRFIADAGHEGEGFDRIREVLYGTSPNTINATSYDQMKRAPGQNFHYDLSLPGDRNFRGLEGRKEIEGKIAHFRTLIEQNPAAAGTMHGSINATLAEVKRQRAEIADPKRYSDLPDELRENQVARLDQYISQLGAQVEDAGFAFTQQDSAAAEAEEGGSVAGGKSGQAAGPAPGLRHVRKEMGILDRTMRFSKSSFEEAKDAYLALQKQALKGRGDLAPDLAKGLSSSGKVWAEANRIKAAAEALDPAVRDLRSRFVESMGAPDSALGAGTAALGQMAMSEKMWSDATEKMWQAEGDLRVLVEA